MSKNGKETVLEASFKEHLEYGIEEIKGARERLLENKENNAFLDKSQLKEYYGQIDELEKAIEMLNDTIKDSELNSSIDDLVKFIEDHNS